APTLSVPRIKNDALVEIASKNCRPCCDKRLEAIERRQRRRYAVSFRVQPHTDNLESFDSVRQANRRKPFLRDRRAAGRNSPITIRNDRKPLLAGIPNPDRTFEQTCRAQTFRTDLRDNSNLRAKP